MSNGARSESKAKLKGGRVFRLPCFEHKGMTMQITIESPGTPTIKITIADTEQRASPATDLQRRAIGIEAYKAAERQGEQN